MNKFKNYLLAITMLLIPVLVFSTPSGESKSSANNIVAGASTVAGIDGIKNLIAVTQMKAQAANDEATQSAEKQRQLVAKQQALRTSQEKAREKAVLQQFEANARRNAEVLKSVKLLAAELKKLDCE